MTSKTFIYVGCLAVAWLLARWWAAPRAQKILFLIVSYILYASWGVGFLGILIFSSLANYGLGMLLRRQPSAARLWLGIGFNIALLGSFKLLPALAGTSIFHFAGASRLAEIALPLGISFWTFQALSYLFDVYQGQEVDPSLLEFCLYMAFWPTVLSGPICRLPDLLTQFRQPSRASRADLRTGVDRVFIGLFMIALARVVGGGIRPGEGVDSAFGATALKWGGSDVWVLVCAYGFQLFLDFAGYSHLVIGAAQLFGFHLPENFDRPFLSTSPSVFWTRWHISLSFWIRDYLFMPLATLRRESWWRNLALLLSMIIFGLWHKVAFLFLVWGTYQGILLLLHRRWQALRRSRGWEIPRALDDSMGWLATFASINLGWIWFRAADWKQAVEMLAAVFRPAGYLVLRLPASLYLLTAVVVGGYFSVAHFMAWVKARTPEFVLRTPLELRAVGYAVLLYVAFLHSAEPQSFIYFQF